MKIAVADLIRATDLIQRMSTDPELTAEDEAFLDSVPSVYIATIAANIVISMQKPLMVGEATERPVDREWLIAYAFDSTRGSYRNEPEILPRFKEAGLADG